MKKFFKHLGTVIKHKAVVFKHCCKCGIFWQGLWHDMSKFSPTEFFESVKFYTDGTKSPLSTAREQQGYTAGWIHHKNRNKHHVEYWYDEQNSTQVAMPFKYAVEAVCDKIAATKIYKKKNYTPQAVLDYFLKESLKVSMNPQMHNFFETIFTDLVNIGEKHILNKKYLQHKYNKIVLKK